MTPILGGPVRWAIAWGDKGAAMIDGNAIRGLARSATLYSRGVFCPAVLWEAVSGRLSVGNAGQLLSELSPELQEVLREAYRERPWSLRYGIVDSEVRHEVEAWCLGEPVV